MNEAKGQLPSIPENCFIACPIRMALLQQPLGMLYPEETMLQIHRNGFVGWGFQRPGHFHDPGFIHCEPIPIICWPENMPNSYPFSLLEPSSKPHTFEAKVAPTCSSCSMWLGSNEVLATSPVSLGPTNAAPLHSSQVPPDWSSQKLPQKIHQRQFRCRYPGCDSQFRRRKALERHLICHSDEKPYVCWVPECHRSFRRSDNLKAHYPTHAKMGGRNRYVATLDNTSPAYSPEFRGQLTLEGWSALE
ncbi:hypothetical protein N7481_001524 [Penicillium waksmanii]|uniref:uncharacterized protein n=1 Tax=Penicillium waksmanii TaxID=69791 RepID=UPI0025472EFE|nr:uncharacterized protein N7481_001524 [Penicillium waksmanii]KAJ6001115.1 hypothetical protein N7481_001524 [Penicillium waksmanii]